VADLTPRQIVQELDRYIVGQEAAKKAVAVAIRNRWRRQQLPALLVDRVYRHADGRLIVGVDPVGLHPDGHAPRGAEQAVVNRLSFRPEIQIFADKAHANKGHDAGNDEQCQSHTQRERAPPDRYAARSAGGSPLIDVFSLLPGIGA